MAYQLMTPELFAEAMRVSSSIRIKSWVPRKGTFKYSWEQCARVTIETLELDPRWWVPLYYLQIIHSNLTEEWAHETRAE